MKMWRGIKLFCELIVSCIGCKWHSKSSTYQMIILLMSYSGNSTKEVTAFRPFTIKAITINFLQMVDTFPIEIFSFIFMILPCRKMSVLMTTSIKSRNGLVIMENFMVTSNTRLVGPIRWWWSHSKLVSLGTFISKRKPIVFFLVLHHRQLFPWFFLLNTFSQKKTDWDEKLFIRFFPSELKFGLKKNPSDFSCSCPTDVVLDKGKDALFGSPFLRSSLFLLFNHPNLFPLSKAAPFTHFSSSSYLGFFDFGGKI